MFNRKYFEWDTSVELHQHFIGSNCIHDIVSVGSNMLFTSSVPIKPTQNKGFQVKLVSLFQINHLMISFFSKHSYSSNI